MDGMDGMDGVDGVRQVGQVGQVGRIGRIGRIGPIRTGLSDDVAILFAQSLSGIWMAVSEAGGGAASGEDNPGRARFERA